MHAVQTLSLFALAGTSLAAPGGWGDWRANYFGHGGDSNSAPAATDVAVVTAYTTVTWDGNWNKPSATAAPAAPETPAASPQAPTPVASAAPTQTASTGSSSGGYMDIVSEWRSKMGMSALTQDDKLQGNALKTVQDGNGQMVHELNSGSMAQVLAPGDASDFEKVFVGGWLCERPDIAGLDGICSTMSQGWSYGGETGHADILTSGSYSKIGCALDAGIWGCDLA